MRLLFGFLMLATVSLVAAQAVPLSPSALTVSADGRVIYVACATANRVLCFDTVQQKIIRSITVPSTPSGLALSPDGTKLFVTCAAPESKVCIVNVANCQIVGTIPAGHTAQSPVPSPDGKTLYVCNRFNNDVSVIDLVLKKEVRRIAVRREPVAADVTKDGKYLLVANHLHDGPANVDYKPMAAVVSVVAVESGKVIKELQLPNGSGELNDLRVSPDGKYAAVTHIVAGFNRTATRVQLGWINANAVTVLDVAKLEVISTILLDEPDRGAANPWGVAWSADGQTLVVTHAGTHEVSLIDFPALLAGLPVDSPKATAPKTNTIVATFVSRYEGLDAGCRFLPVRASESNSPLVISVRAGWS